MFRRRFTMHRHHHLASVSFSPLSLFISKSILNKENTMQSSVCNKIEGTFHEVKGKIKEVAGKLADDPNLEADGTDEKIAGQVQEKSGHHGTGCGVRSGRGGRGSCGGGRPGGGTGKATSD
jgi:uncharacterized protein YjbJ (UPF0337 family)